MENIIHEASAVLAINPDRWLLLAERLPSGLFGRSPAKGEWSAQECLLHLIDTEQWVFPVRVKAFLAGQDFPAFHPDTQGRRFNPDQVARDLAEEFARLRSDSLALLKTLKPADLERRARHAELGPVSLSELLHEWAAHDLMHTVQGERALMQPFIQGCGAWQVYFKDHFVS